MQTSRGLIPALLFFLLLSSCKKDVKIEPQVPDQPVVVPTKQPEVAFNFKAFVKDAALTTTGFYVNALGDSFSVSKYNYYISNIKFKKEDGTVFSEPESYHLNKHLEGQEAFVITGLPEGTYTDIEFLIGVDSARNVSGSQTGALAVAQGMFWTWNTGYVFFKLEGLCKTAADPNWKDYAIHVGGFSAPYNCLQTCKIHLSKAILAKNNKRSTVSWHMHVDEIFSNPVDLGFDSYNAVSGGKLANNVAANYKDMFEVSSVEN